MAGIGLLTVSTAAQDPCYRVVDLGALGYTPTIDDMFGINSANQAVFTAVVIGDKHAMLYLPVGAYGLAKGVHDLHNLAGTDITGDESVAHDINSAGIVVGWAEIGSDRHAFVWRLDRDPFEFIDLETFDGGDWSEAWAISDDSPIPWIAGKGHIRGNCSCDPDGPQNDDLERGFALKLITPAPVLEDASKLGRDLAIGCENITAASDINNGPQPTAAGFSFFGGGQCSDGPGTALYWPDPDPPNPKAGVALPLLPSGLGSVARGVSNLGALSGVAITSGSQAHAAYWDTVASPIVDLGSLVGMGAQTWGWRMNNNEPPGGVIQVVGDTGAFGQGLLWQCSAGCDLVGGWSVTILEDDTLNLCSSAWDIGQAHDVNDNGWIIGVGHSGTLRAVVLAPLATCPPVPECLGDIDGNDVVGATDLLALLVAWGPCPDPPAACDADLNCDGTVGALDLLILLTNWGPCGSLPGSPPEDIMDCIDRFCCDPEDLLALEKCICLVDPECTPSP